MDPKVGIGVIVCNEGKVLLGKRKNSHGAGCWGLPGGKLLFGEDILECAEREVKEETDLDIIDTRIVTITNDIFHEDSKHFVTVFVLAKTNNPFARAMEPDKCEEWQWHSWSALPKPLFSPLQKIVESGFNPKS